MDTKILINDLLNDYYTAAWLGAMPDMPANEHQIVSVCGLTCSVGQQKLRVAFLFFFFNGCTGSIFTRLHALSPKIDQLSQNWPWRSWRFPYSQNQHGQQENNLQV